MVALWEGAVSYGRGTPVVTEAELVTGLVLQGHLAHKKMPTSLGPP